ncbi:hypothetical protein [Pasteurella multocida]|uniref:hypothetical protein n=1 Tax=Pasteurella multocida TaxID=747 RepID=UPI00234134DF|nr:hypothetical protein [Pasteurella multocida]MDC4236822.1 hypothetical protein [Pasteurella multocida]
MATQQQIIDAFYRLYQAYHNKRFTRTLNFTQKTERELLPLVRNYLLGYFDHLEPEAMVQVTASYRGRFDFLIDNVAVELALRSARKGGNNLRAQNNEKEIIKLIKHPDHSLMVLFDFKGHRTDKDVIETLKEYRNIPSLGSGNHHRYPFTVAYFYQAEDGLLYYYTRRIRVKRRPVSLIEDQEIIEQNNIISKRDLTAWEYDLDSRDYIQSYSVEIRVKDKELTIEYQDEEGNYHQYKGSEVELDQYELISSQNSNNKANVSLYIDEDDSLSVDGILVEDGYVKEWIIEND